MHDSLDQNGLGMYRVSGLVAFIDARDATIGGLLAKFSPVTAFSQLQAPAITSTSAFVLVSGTLQRLDLSFGTISWSFAGDGLLTSAPIVVGDRVVIGSSSGTVYAVDFAGKEQWSARLPAVIEPIVEGQSVMLTGLAAGEGHLVVPASNTLTAWRLAP